MQLHVEFLHIKYVHCLGFPLTLHTHNHVAVHTAVTGTHSHACTHTRTHTHTHTNTHTLTYAHPLTAEGINYMYTCAFGETQVLAEFENYTFDKVYRIRVIGNLI